MEKTFWITSMAALHLKSDCREAIERKLLCPFQYFGVSDDVDLSNIRWTRGGYDKAELNNVFSLNRAVAEKRAGHIVNSLYRYVTDINTVRGLGFCVSVEHAEFMEEYFSSKGIPCMSLYRYFQR